MWAQALVHECLIGPLRGNRVAFLPARRLMAQENVQYPVEPGVERTGIRAKLKGFLALTPGLKSRVPFTQALIAKPLGNIRATWKNFF